MIGALQTDIAMLRIGLPVCIKRELDEHAKALLAHFEGILGPLSLSDISHQAQLTSAWLKLAGTNFYGEAGPILAAVTGLEGQCFAAGDALV